MIKTLLIISCLLFTLSFAQEEDGPSCFVSYEGYAAEPECGWVTDENGEESEECTAIGSPIFAGVLTPDEPTSSSTDFNPFLW